MMNIYTNDINKSCHYYILVILHHTIHHKIAFWYRDARCITIWHVYINLDITIFLMHWLTHYVMHWLMHHLMYLSASNNATWNRKKGKNHAHRSWHDLLSTVDVFPWSMVDFQWWVWCYWWVRAVLVIQVCRS